MALWGTADSLYSVGTVQVNYATKEVIGSGTSFTAAGISTGDVITIGAGGTFGSAVISGITSDRLISIATTQYLTGSVISGVAYTLSERPVYTLEDSNYSANVVGVTTTVPTHGVYGVDIYEAAALAPGNSGLSTQYGGIHAGWVGIHTYIDMHGNLRVKSETLVAMSGISTNGPATYTAAGDANDDAIYPDRYIIVSISASPSNVVGVGTTVTFTASATATPGASLSYQWQKSTAANGTTYSNISGATGISTDITNSTTGNNNYNYRVLVTSTDGATATSSPIKLTVTA